MGIFNWKSGEWRRTAGDLGEGRSSHGCTSYISPEDGSVRVLVAGGWSGHNIRTAEVYNPATERWRVVGDLTFPRRGLTLETAEGGRVMALGAGSPQQWQMWISLTLKLSPGRLQLLYREAGLTTLQLLSQPQWSDASSPSRSQL